MKKKAQFDFSELNPIAAAVGLIGGIAVFAIMGNTGAIKVGIIWRLLGLIGGAVAGYLVFHTIMNK